MRGTDAISRSAALEKMGKLPLCWEYGQAVAECWGIVNDLPALDVAPVVRCKDCKHYKPQNQGAHRNCTTPYCTRVCTIKVSPDDFCSRGERKAGESHD